MFDFVGCITVSTRALHFTCLTSKKCVIRTIADARLLLITHAQLRHTFSPHSGANTYNCRHSRLECLFFLPTVLRCCLCVPTNIIRILKVIKVRKMSMYLCACFCLMTLNKGLNRLNELYIESREQIRTKEPVKRSIKPYTESFPACKKTLQLTANMR